MSTKISLYFKIQLTNYARKYMCSMLVEKLWRIADHELEEGLQKMMILERIKGQLVATMKMMMK
jgi:hypothetical protein